MINCYRPYPLTSPTFGTGSMVPVTGHQPDGVTVGKVEGIRRWRSALLLYSTVLSKLQSCCRPSVRGEHDTLTPGVAGHGLRPQAQDAFAIHAT